MLKLNDGRSELWQWDTVRKLAVDADCSQVHFSNNVFGRSIDVDVVDGVASIPDILLQTDKDLTAWAFVGTAENGYTKISKVFKVNKRNKPADYVFTPTDQTTLCDILNRIEYLENRPSGDVSEEDIQNAVDKYLDETPISVKEKDPTVPEWAKQPEPPKVDFPKTLPNPHKLTFTGAVQAKYDGSNEVSVEIPEGGSGCIPVPETAEVGQTIVVKEVDENGKPTKWEAADMESADGEKWETIADITTTEEVDRIYITTDLDGNPFVLDDAEIRILVAGTPTNTSEAALFIRTNLNTAAGGGTNDAAIRAFRTNSSALILFGLKLASHDDPIKGTIHNIGGGSKGLAGYYNNNSNGITAFFFYGGTFGVGSRVVVKGVKRK